MSLLTKDTKLNNEKLSLVKKNNISQSPFIHLQQLYEFEFSTFTKYEINSQGLYDQKMLISH